MQMLNRRVLVVDGNPDSRDRVLRALSSAGFNCSWAEDGEQAINALDSQAFSLMVTDVVLPKVHGHALVVKAQSQAKPPRIVVVTDICDPRLIRDLLARGVDDYLHKSVPDALLSTKIQALFELDSWKQGQKAGNANSEELARDVALGNIERHLQRASEFYSERLAPLFDLEYAIPDLPPSIAAFVKRQLADERADLQAGITSMANVRGSQRLEFTASATAYQVDEHFQPIDNPVTVMIRDLSATGARMMHTRAIPATDLVLAWQAETLPFYTFRVPLSVTRCRASGRFYDIGGQFDIPPEASSPTASITASQPAATS